MKKILLWDMRFPKRDPIRLNVADTIASAIVRSGVGAAADPADAGALSTGSALDPTMLTEVVLQHGAANNMTARVFLPYSVVLVGAAAGMLASIGTPIAGLPAPLPTVTLSASISKAEGNSGANLYTYTVTRSATAGAISVPWSFAAGTTSADDFTGGSYPAGSAVALADGQASGTFAVSVNGDTVVEADELFTVTISPPAGYSAGASLSATGTILNDDAAATPQLTATPASKTIAANSPSGTLLFAIGNVPAGVTPTVSPNDGRFAVAGDATNGWKVVTGLSALSAGSVSVTAVAAGATSVAVAVTISAVTLPKLSAGIARVKAGTGRAVVAMIGDSVTDGWGGGATTGTATGTTPSVSPNFKRANSYPSQLAASYTAAGVPSRSDAFISGVTKSEAIADLLSAYPNMTAGTGWSVSNIASLGGGLLTCSSSGTGALTFQPLFTADTFDIIVTGFSGLGQFTVTDVASGTILATIDETDVTQGIKQGTSAARIVPVTRSAHTTDPISIQRISGGALFIIAIIPRDSTSPRLEFLNMGYPGSKTNDWVTTADNSAWAPIFALGLLNGYIDAFQIELGPNDANGSVAASTYQTNLQTLATKLSSYGDGTLVKTHPANPTTNSYNLPSAYLSAIDTVQASLNSNPALDFNSLSYVTSDYYDSIHLAQPGYGKEASAWKAYTDAKV